MTDPEAKAIGIKAVTARMGRLVIYRATAKGTWTVVGTCSSVFQGRDWCAVILRHFSATIIIDSVSARVLCRNLELCDVEITPEGVSVPLV